MSSLSPNLFCRVLFRLLDIGSRWFHLKSVKMTTQGPSLCEITELKVYRSGVLLFLSLSEDGGHMRVKEFVH